jgi:hypothetical protein
MVSWEAITALSGLGVTIITAAIAYGRLRQRVSDMGKQIATNTARIEAGAKRLSDGDSDLKVIGVKIDNMLTNQVDFKQQMKEMDDRLRRHCEERGP